MAAINYTIGDNWGSGFIGNMTVPGGNQGLHGWVVEFDASFDISNIWGAEIVSHVANHYVIRNAAWTADVAVDGQARFGFQATPGSGGTAATGFTLNGATDSPPPPPLPALSIDDAAISEGDGGTAQLTFTVRLSQAAAGPVTVNYATANGTATAASDYSALSGTLSFAAGETSKSITVPIIGDTTVEPNETFTVSLTGASGASIADGSAVGTIVNNDAPPPTLSVADAAVVEGNGGAQDLAFAVTLSAAAAGPVTVAYATGNGSATAGSDFAALAGILTFAAGETAKVVHVQVSGDSAVEANETLTLALSAPSGATIARATATGTITNDDVPAPPPAAGASLHYDVASNWGSGFTATMAVGAGSAALDGWTAEFDASFTITGIWNAVIVSHAGDHYVVRNADWNGAIAGGHAASFGFQATPGAGGTAAAGFKINGAAAGSDPLPAPPTLSVADATVAEGNSATHDLAFTVALSAAATGPVTVAYATSNGTATAGSDYTAASGTLTFAAGETAKVVHVQVAGDSAVENNETLTLTLSSPAGATIADGTAIGTITNDDAAALPTLSIGDASFAEGSAGAPGQATFTVTLSAASTSPVTVNFATADGTAINGTDYVGRTGSLTFAAGETSKTIQVSAVGDGVVEANEGFTVVLANPSGATLADGTGAGTITDDDVAAPVLPTLGISDASVVEGDPGNGSGATPGWFSTSGNQIVDSAGHPVQIAGVNWFGFESSNLAPHGLWARGYHDMMDQMKELGFNAIRLPFSNDTIHGTATPNGIDFARNPDLQGLSALQILDKIVSYAGEIGLKVILDHHRNDSGPGTSPNGLWFDGQHSEAQWVSDWQMLATRYAGNPTVIGADLHNEPFAGTWGGGGPTDWAAAAERAGNAIGTVNPNWLIFVEGVADYQGQSYWWGGNLMGVKDRPIDLGVANKLVYSAHDYPNSVYAQPWFQGSDFAQGLPAKFDQMWGYIYKQGIAPVYIGEFGTNLTDPKDAPWLKAITAYMAGDLDNDGTSDIAAGQHGPSWTFWSWNPNSGDTGGILANDWSSVNQNKMAYLTPIEFDLGSEPAGGPLASFLLTLSAPATQAVTVDFHTLPGEAAGQDFTGASGSVTFAPGEQSKTIAIAITPDDLAEGNEHFSVVLTNVRGAMLADATGSATIVDDDGAVSALAAPPVTAPTDPAGDPSGDPSGTLAAHFALSDSWSSGFNGNVVVHNDGSATPGWQVVVDMPYQITDIWNARILSHDAGGYVIGPAAWNGALAHDGETSFGFGAAGAFEASSLQVHGGGDAAVSPAPSAPPSVATAAAALPADDGHMFSPYIDMAMPVDADLEGISAASGIRNFTLAFVLGSSQGIGWQGWGSIDQDTLADGTSILDHVQAIQAAGGNITISFGGAAGTEAALQATSAAQLQGQYQSVIDRYHVHSIDFDIEGTAALDQHSITLRDQAIVGLQAANPDLKVSFTLPVLPTGLTADGLHVLHSAMADGVRVDIVNIMAMDYGQSVDNGGQMGLSAIQASEATQQQLAAIGLHAKLGITPMIGVNDIASEVFTPADARDLVDYAAHDPDVAMLSMWSVARDNGASAGAHNASSDSSGVAQNPFEFAAIFQHYDIL